MADPHHIWNTFSAFAQELEAITDNRDGREWDTFTQTCEVQSAKKRAVLFPQTEICNRVIYLMEGIVASEYRYEDKHVITRFFQKGNFSANIVSAATGALAGDNLIAITDVVFISIPFDQFIEWYLHSDYMGLFIRKKIIQNSLENKHFTTIKTISSTEKRYQFLENHYPEVIRHTPSKHIASFLGISPEALSRFLSKRYKS
ncbi:MAG: Crp/Fnr family transcriptional regulator [Bacteroidota bacterium]